MKNNENHIFIDTNCIIGYIADKYNLKRKKDAANSNALAYLLKQNGKKLYISSLSIAQATATLQNRIDNTKLISEIRSIVSRYEVVEFNKQDIAHAIGMSQARDIEDLYQYRMSQKVKCLYVMTNNIKDYSAFQNIIAFTPKQTRKIIF